ncbi:MAG: SPOR domain-containing protein [Candidatus Omnitrophota bacterium]
MRNRIIICALLAFLAASRAGYAYDRDEKRDFDKIEHLFLKEDFPAVKKKCDRFLREYRGSRLRKRVEYLEEVAEQKISQPDGGTVSDVDYGAGKAGAVKTKAFYVVQVGAFKDYRNADKLAKALKKQKFEAVILKVRRGNAGFYRVRVGKFRDLGNAERLVRDLRKKGYAPEIVNEA